MTFKISEFNKSVESIVEEMPPDELVVEDAEGELIHIDKVYYSLLTGFIHIKLGKSFEDDDEDD